MKAETTGTVKNQTPGIINHLKNHIAFKKALLDLTTGEIAALEREITYYTENPLETSERAQNDLYDDSQIKTESLETA